MLRWYVVALPGTYVRRLETAAGKLLDDISFARHWMRRGRAEVLELTSDTVGLISLFAILHLPAPLRTAPAADARPRSAADARPICVSVPHFTTGPHSAPPVPDAHHLAS